MSLLLPRSVDPVAFPVLTTSEHTCSLPQGYASQMQDGLWKHINSSQLVFFSTVSCPAYDSFLLGPTSVHCPESWPLCSLSFSGFPVSHLQVLVLNLSLCEQKLTLHQQCQSMNTGALLITVSGTSVLRYWTLLRKLMHYSVFRDICFSNKERSFPPVKSGNRAISETQGLLCGASLGFIIYWWKGSIQTQVDHEFKTLLSVNIPPYVNLVLLKTVK